MAYVAARHVCLNCIPPTLASQSTADVPDQPAIVRQYMRYTAQIQTGLNAGPMVMRALQMSVYFNPFDIPRIDLRLISATSEPKGPVYLWARRETTEEEIDASILSENLKVSKWPTIQSAALPASGKNQTTSCTYLMKLISGVSSRYDYRRSAPGTVPAHHRRQLRTKL